MPALCPLRDKECVYEKCAWYDQIHEQCCVRLLTKLAREASWPPHWR